MCLYACDIGGRLCTTASKGKRIVHLQMSVHMTPLESSTSTGGTTSRRWCSPERTPLTQLILSLFKLIKCWPVVMES